MIGCGGGVEKNERRAGAIGGGGPGRDVREVEVADRAVGDVVELDAFAAVVEHRAVGEGAGDAGGLAGAVDRLEGGLVADDEHAFTGAEGGD